MMANAYPPPGARLNRFRLRAVAALVLLASIPALSQSSDSDQPYSSSAALPDAPGSPNTTTTVVKKTTTYHAFSAFAIAFKIGTGGIGGDLATPLANWANLRVSVQAFDHPLKFRTSGIYSTADLTIQNAAVSVDLYPFHNSSFHLSPGVVVYGDNHVASSLLVPGGSAFLLGPDGYTSDPADPVTGFARIRFGNPVAPRLTLGWGNMIPHSGHFSVPFEIGFQYITPPTVSITLNGSVCDNQNNCGPVDQGEEATDLQTEINELNADLAPLRFYPVIAIGFSYKFGH
jgi:hypothetical protein